MQPKVRPFKEKDIDAVAQMLAGVPDGWSRTALEESLSNSSIKSFVLEAEETAAAFASFLVADDAELVFIVTDKSQQKQGYGEKLLRETLAAIGLPCVLEVRESNAAAISLYQKTGFEKIGVRKNFYSDPKESAVIYKKEI